MLASLLLIMPGLRGECALGDEEVHLSQDPSFLIAFEVLPKASGLVICADPHHHGTTLSQASGLLRYGTREGANTSPRRRAPGLLWQLIGRRGLRLRGAGALQAPGGRSRAG
ncbi:hypothetical protein SSAG_00317 [Streptomyces sp. Mg1]|nr:hypothetical protein SSAG_00317 [Streptomyces sp. Mg1]